MLQFAHESALYLLLIPVLGVVAVLWLQRKWNTALLRNLPIIPRLAPGWLPRKRNIEWILLFLSMTFLVIGLADPRIGTKIETVERKGADVVLVLDVSKSMDAVDVAPSRIDYAKYKINRLLDRLGNDRLALIFVSSRPFLQIPMTIDASIIRTWLEAVDTDVLPGGGTDIGGALLLAAQQFQGDPARDRGVVLLTDGEDQEGNLAEAQQELKKTGAKLFVIGIGTAEGGPIPLKHRMGQYKTDQSGQMVTTRLVEGEIRNIASSTGGQYLRWRGDEGDISAILNGISQLDKRKVGEKVVTEFESRGLWFAWIGLLLLIAERLLPLGRPYHRELWIRLKTLTPVKGWNKEPN